MAIPNHMNMIDEIDRVFELEINTLNNVRKHLDKSYLDASEMLFQCSGKVIVTGMGKSGLIAQKISSTMVSTGTEAMFLHPGDGLHGDVGIIREGDVVLALSKSGETEELLGLLLYVKKIGVPVITITAKPESMLAKSSNLVLFTPIEEEACPLNLAPTSSTTAALVVGDALAMTLMKKRGITPDQFALWHPGGQLGRRLLLTVADVMRSGEDNPAITADTNVRVMLYEMSSKRCGAVSIISGDRELIGLVTDYDVRRNLEGDGDIFSSTIPDIMNPNPSSAYSDDLAITALETMRNRPNPFLVLPVLDRTNNKVVGMIHLHDLINKGL
jgi:arabinose-5-phosphate isomerase